MISVDRSSRSKFQSHFGFADAGHASIQRLALLGLPIDDLFDDPAPRSGTLATWPEVLTGQQLARVRSEESDNMTRSLAIIATHPIQYQAPLYEYLSRNGVSLKVFFLSDHGFNDRYDAEFGRSIAWDIPLIEGYPNEFLPNLRRTSAAEHFFGLINPRIVTQLRTGDFSAVLVNGHRNLSMVMAGLTAKAARIPLLYRSDRCRPASQRLRRIGGPLFKSAVTACLSAGSMNDRFYESLGIPESRRFLVPYAVDNERFQAAAKSVSKEAAREELGLGDRGLVVLSAGKLVPWKQPDLLIRAFAVAAPPDASLVFVGEGSMRSQLEQWASTHLPGRVTFLGFMNQTKIPLAYRSADLLVLPSSREAWGLAVNEAMNFGVPALVSDQVGCRVDLITPGRTGDIFNASDQASLERALRMLLSDPDALGRMGRNARARIDQWGLPQAAAGLACAMHSLGAAE